MAKLDLNVIANEGEDTHQVIQFNGELDKSNNLDVRNALSGFIDGFQLNTLIIDLTYFDFINSEGVGMLVSLFYKMAKLNKKFIIINAQPRVSDVFNIIGLNKIVPVFGDLSEALTNI
jgi:stage II sporulation protein AA (anti-sigma F factor antagonist)